MVNFKNFGQWIFLVTALSILPMLCFGIPKKEVKVWTDYEFPPFIENLAEKKGLTFDMLKTLNQESNHPYHYVLEILPRKRIDYYLLMKKEGVVIWTNPTFFGKQAEKKYYWSHTLFKDQQEILSPSAKPVEFDGTIKSIMGNNFGGILGQRYRLIDAASKMKQLHRQDVFYEIDLIRMILKERFDFITLPRSTAQFFEKSMRLKGKIHYSKICLSQYSRKFLIPKYMRDLVSPINQKIEKFRKSGTLKSMVKKYGIYE